MILLGFDFDAASKSDRVDVFDAPTELPGHLGGRLRTSVVAPEGDGSVRQEQHWLQVVES